MVELVGGRREECGDGVGAFSSDEGGFCFGEEVCGVLSIATGLLLLLLLLVVVVVVVVVVLISVLIL